MNRGNRQNPQHRRVPAHRTKPLRQSGAAMLTVMLMLLVGTTIAAMTVFSITLEARSSGYYRQQAQTHYVAEAAMQAFLALPPSVADARDKADRLLVQNTPPADEPFPCDVTNASLMCNYGEPDPNHITGGAAGVRRRVVRMGADPVRDSLIADGGGTPIQHAPGDSSLGVQAFRPWYVVDLSDIEDATVAGQDASGNSPFKFLHATVTVRARTLLDDGAGAIAFGGAPTTSGVSMQAFTTGAYDMRAVVQLGPVPK